MNSSLILNQPGFVLANARVLAAASQAAYGAGTNSEPSHVVSYVNKATGAHAVVTGYDDCTVIAFRGTACPRDWLTDAEFVFRRVPQGRVHEGFLRSADAVLPAIIERLWPAGMDQPQTKPILMTGHSLGGALAVLAGFFLAQQGFPVASVYTFGQPRVGDGAFAAAYSALLGAKTFRVVNQNDLVPRVPGVLLGYRHAGELAFINALGGLVLNPPLVARLLSDGLGLCRAYRRREEVLITEHFVANYVAALKRCHVAELQGCSVAELQRGNVPTL